MYSRPTHAPTPLAETRSVDDQGRLCIESEGRIVEAFTPDFYLPDLDLYLEMTTLRQKLVRKKNRKLRRLRELYPSINIKLFYARDFRALMLMYGKLALVADMSGSSGQVALPHGPALAVQAPAAPLATDRQPASPLAAAVIGTGRRHAAPVGAVTSNLERETGGR